ncbi:MAG: beta-ketoacyl-ACP synthase II [Oscillospiraceae bacterium]|jgi:3-oxoacyl-[acyl-carrier-protein] synthase II|nr:beta-ketoacyl-ACP synthase II [Oscillospiraceae bacterium]
MKNRVVITGMGAVTPIGNTHADFWAAIRRGDCGVSLITAYDTSNQTVKLAAEVKIDVEAYIRPADARKMDRFTQLAVIAAREALSDSGVTAENTDLTRAGVIISSGIGGLSTTEREHSRGLERGFDRVSPFFIPMTIPNMAAGRVAMEAGFLGACSCVVTACAGGANAIGESLRAIRHGYLDVMLCGGAEACVTPLAVGGFTSMKALHEGGDPARASIPFDRERSGFILGEGAGILVLEELERAKRRGARIYAEVMGFGESCDAYHITAPDPEGRGASLAMRNAVADAGLAPAEVDYINAHGTSTPLNDKCETLAIRTVFGASARVPVSSTKSMTGHLLGAAGAAEAIVCACAVRDGFIPATVNLRNQDPECDLNVVAGAGVASPVRHALSNSLGFGGHNAALVISRYEGD